jgi:hypothetical protein
MANLYKISVGKPERRDHSEDLSVDGRIILKWINLAEDRGQWRALVNTLMNLVFHKKGRSHHQLSDY